jgi:hypothetical protein
MSLVGAELPPHINPPCWARESAGAPDGWICVNCQLQKRNEAPAIRAKHHGLRPYFSCSSIDGLPSLTLVT